MDFSVFFIIFTFPCEYTLPKLRSENNFPVYLIKKKCWLNKNVSLKFKAMRMNVNRTQSLYLGSRPFRLTESDVIGSSELRVGPHLAARLKRMA